MASEKEEVVSLTLTIVDTNRRTRAARCSRMIPRSRSSIFTDYLSDEERRQGVRMLYVCVWMPDWGGYGCVTAAH